MSITSPLNPITLLEAGGLDTAAAQATDSWMHQSNDPKCSELGGYVSLCWSKNGAWGKEAFAIISSAASRLATSTCRPKSIVLNKIYGRLNFNLACPCQCNSCPLWDSSSTIELNSVFMLLLPTFIFVFTCTQYIEILKGCPTGQGRVHILPVRL